MNALFDACDDGPEFGYRLRADEARDQGQAMAGRAAWRICSQNRWWGVFGKDRGKDGKPGRAVHDDLCVVINERGGLRCSPLVLR